MRLNVVKFLLFLSSALLLAACHYPQKGDAWSSYGQQKVDSAEFRTHHHYWKGFNFVATDSLHICSRAPFEPQLAYVSDSLRTVRPHNLLIVEDIQTDTTDTAGTFWVRIAALSSRDFNPQAGKITTGWVREQELLAHTVPDTPISKFIHGFSNARLKFILTCIGLAIVGYFLQTVRRKHIHMVHFNDIGSFYPTLLCMLVSGTAVLYQSMQVYVPDTWVEYYFHPVLNPLTPDLAPIIALFISAVWALILVSVAVFDDLLRRPDFTDAFSYLLGLASVCMVLYIFFTTAVPPLLAYPLLAVYWVFAIRRYRAGRCPRYLCGNCGAPLEHVGRCPRCGMINE